MLKRSVVFAVVLTVTQAVVNVAPAAPMEYTFSTGVVLPFGGSTPAAAELNAEATAIAGMFDGAIVSGSLRYDPSVPQSGTALNGSSIYSSLTNLSATVAGGSIGSGFSFSDPLGMALVGNEVLSGADLFQLQADPFGPTGTHDITSFIIGDYYLWNVRMFWIEGQMAPEPVPDLVNDQNLPSELPNIHGRLALDFKRTGDTSGNQYHLFFDSLSVSSVAAVPEPPTYAVLLGGLAMLGFAMRRRSRALQG